MQPQFLFYFFIINFKNEAMLYFFTNILNRIGFLNQSVWKILIPKTIMYKNLCIFVIQNEMKWKIHNYIKEFEHHHYEIAGGKRQMYGYEITQK
jgi:hypothetical protein